MDRADLLVNLPPGLGGRHDQRVLALPELDGEIHRQRGLRNPLFQARDLEAVQRDDHTAHPLAARHQAGEPDALVFHPRLIPGRRERQLQGRQCGDRRGGRGRRRRSRGGRSGRRRLGHHGRRRSRSGRWSRHRGRRSRHRCDRRRRGGLRRNRRRRRLYRDDRRRRRRSGGRRRRRGLVIEERPSLLKVGAGGIDRRHQEDVLPFPELDLRDDAFEGHFLAGDRSQEGFVRAGKLLAIQGDSQAGQGLARRDLADQLDLLARDPRLVLGRPESDPERLRLWTLHGDDLEVQHPDVARGLQKLPHLGHVPHDDFVPPALPPRRRGAPRTHHEGDPEGHELAGDHVNLFVGVHAPGEPGRKPPGRARGPPGTLERPDLSDLKRPAQIRRGVELHDVPAPLDPREPQIPGEVDLGAGTGREDVAVVFDPDELVRAVQADPFLTEGIGRSFRPRLRRRGTPDLSRGDAHVRGGRAGRQRQPEQKNQRAAQFVHPNAPRRGIAVSPQARGNPREAITARSCWRWSPSCRAWSIHH